MPRHERSGVATRRIPRAVPVVDHADDLEPAGGFDPSAGTVLEAAAGLEPITPPGAQPRTPKRRGRKPLGLSAEQRKERKRMLERERRARRKALEAARAVAGGHAPAAAPAAADDDPLEDTKHEAAIEHEQLEVLLGLAAYAVLAPITRRLDGGTLTEEERKLLGGVWAAALKPHLQGTASLMAVAGITTVQVLALRWVQARQAQAGQSEPTPTDDRTDRAEPTPAQAAADAAPATARRGERFDL